MFKKLWDDLKLGYTEMTGNPLLREEIAKLHDVDKDDVLVVVPQEGIYIAMKCLFNVLKRFDSILKMRILLLCIDRKCI